MTGLGQGGARGQALLIGDIIRRAAATVPNAPAVSVGGAQRDDAELSYAELDRDANRLAHALRSELGIGHGDRVLGWADTALEVLPLFVALAKLGAVFAPLNARLGAEEAGEVARLARGALLVVDLDHATSADSVAKFAGVDRWALLPCGEARRRKGSLQVGSDSNRSRSCNERLRSDPRRQETADSKRDSRESLAPKTQGG